MKSKLAIISVIVAILGQIVPVSSSAFAQATAEGSNRAKDQSASDSERLAPDPAAPLLEGQARREDDSFRSATISEVPCLGGGHYYVASVVNSVPSSCFLGNKGPAIPGGL